MYKKHTFEDRVKYMYMLDDGYSIEYIHRHYGVNSTLLSILYRKYLSEGVDALRKKSYSKLSANDKLLVIREFQDNQLTLEDICYKYNISHSAFSQWRKKYAFGGIEALQSDGRGRARKDMGRPKKHKEPQTEVEVLRAQVERLTIENELLKKVKALVEARENRLKEIGRKPSKN